jgi:hypothetical protein
MRWLTSAATMVMLIGLPLTVDAHQHQHRDDRAAPETYLQQVDETPAVTAGDAMRGMMSCPMMGQMGAGPMRGMSPANPGPGGMSPGMGAEGRSGMGPRMGVEGRGMAGPRPGMMGMMAMPGPDADPKTRGRWMQMHGEMMKAMGDIMLRYGRELESGK